MSLPQRVADELARVPGVVAVVLGGSRASGRADAGSDTDIGIYYAAGAPPALADLEDVARSLQRGAPARLAAPGEWGPWMNGGGWLTVEEGGEAMKLDWVLRDLGRVATVFDECCAGTVTCDYYLGHPHGFHNHYYLAEAHHCIALHDPADRVGQLKQRLTPYPPKLKQALIDKYLYDAGFMLDLSLGSVAREDVLHVTGCFFRCAAALVQVLFALNEQFTMNEKKSLPATRSFEHTPRQFADRTTRILASPGADATTLTKSHAEMRALIAETRSIAPPLTYCWPSSPD